MSARASRAHGTRAGSCRRRAGEDVGTPRGLSRDGFVARLHAAEASDDVLAAGFSRVYWYAWTRFGPDDLIELAPGTAGAAALATLAMTVAPPLTPAG